MLIPRDYQKVATQSIRDYFANKKGNPVVVMPGATGKSVVIADFINDCFNEYPQSRIIVLHHVRELIIQNVDKLKRIMKHAPVGIYSAGLNIKETHYPIVFASIQSVVNNIEAFGWRDLILIDECDLVPPSGEGSYLTVINSLQKINPKLKVIGFTATPFRTGQGLITEGGKIFTDICIDMTTRDWFAWFIANNYLCRPIPQRTRTQIDLTGVGLIKGEYNLTELQAASDKMEITIAACKEAISYGAMRRTWLTFCSGIEHAEHTAEVFTRMGIETKAITQKTNAKDRREWLAAWKAGELRNISNNSILTVGIDCPQLDMLVILRATNSTRLFHQIVYRGMRISPGKDSCLTLDFAGNTGRLGTIDAPVIPKKKGEGTGEIPIKICEPCGVYNHISARVCCGCGAAFSFEVKFAKHSASKELIGVEPPIVENLPVSKIIYAKNTNKKTGNETVKVTYYCGGLTVNEFLGFGGKGYFGHQAKEWWRRRNKIECPQSVDEALTIINKSVIPSTIRVWCNKKPYPELMGVEF